MGVSDGRHDRVAAHEPRRASPPSIARATRARSGSARTKAFRRSRAGSRSSARRFAATWLKPAGLYLGTTGGEVWASTNEGGRWRQIAAHLPEIYSVVAVERL